MNIRNLDRLFHPDRVAVIGASRRAGSVGDTVLRNLVESYFAGEVYPVNPKHETIRGVRAYSRVGETPERTDLAVICTPAKVVPGVVRECGEAGVGAVVIISAGFGEDGEEGRRLEEQVRSAREDFRDLRVVGPNCLGVMAPETALNASFAAGMPRAGRVAFVSQSGALCTSVLDWALEEGIGFSYFVSVGNMIDVDFGDLIDFFGQDEKTTSMVLYAESISDARKFISAARAFTSTKPLIAYKAGRFAESAEAAVSHTGAMAGADEVYDAALRRAGVERALEIGEVFDCAELLARSRLPRGPRLAVVTNAGGPGVIAADALLARDGRLAELSKSSVEELDDRLPAYWSGGNPVDVLGDARADRYREAVRIVLDDDAVDAVLVILTPQAMTEPAATAGGVGKLASRSQKPVLATWMGGRAVREGIERLEESGVPTYPMPEQAVQAFMHLVSFAHRRAYRCDTPPDQPVDLHLDADGARKAFAEFLEETEGETLSEHHAKKLLTAYGVPVAETAVARSADEAAKQAERLGYPVALKVVSPQVTHKSDAGGVALGLNDAQDVARAYDRIARTVSERQPDAQFQGVTVQPMVEAEHPVELILGAKKDATFGTVVMAGAGGTATELFTDRALELPPLSRGLARRMLRSLRIWRLLSGYRGRPPCDVDGLVDVLVRFSYLVAEHPEIKEFDVNPLWAAFERVVALDARAVVDRSLSGTGRRAYDHLAIRPYPVEYVRCEELEDGTPVTLRPIRADDERMWQRVLGGGAPDIPPSFERLLRLTTHAATARHCFVDYEQELTIVAELPSDEEGHLVAIGRLAVEPAGRTGDCALLVAKRWQDRGLGAKVTGFLLEIARRWDLESIRATVESDDDATRASLRDFHFQPQNGAPANVVTMEKALR